MLALLSAEWRKMTGQRWVTGFLLWIWPIGGAILCMILWVGQALSPVTRGQWTDSPFRWTDAALGAWLLPTNLFGRLFLIAYAARQFAGEYQWGTWRGSVPYTRRWRLLAAKFSVLSLFVVLVFFVLSVVMVIGLGVVQLSITGTYPPAPTPEIFQAFLLNYLIQVGGTFLGALIGAAFAGLAAIMTRSMMGGIVGGLLIVFMELGFLTSVTVFGILLNQPGIADWVRFTPSHNIANLSSWAFYGQPSPVLVQGVRVNSPAESFLVLGLWLVGLIGACVVLFGRQELE
jgi:ABC-type transport system involved in multi-copper enzyme maturation permease subunit